MCRCNHQMARARKVQHFPPVTRIANLSDVEYARRLTERVGECLTQTHDVFAHFSWRVVDTVHLC